jgi:hypothetical protein
MLRILWGYPRSRVDQTDFRITEPWDTNVYSGEVGNHSFVIGDVWMGFGGVDRPRSVCVLDLGEMLPALFVNLRAREPLIRFAI